MKKGGKGVSIIHLSCCSFGIGIYQGSVLQYGMHNDGSVEYILLGIPQHRAFWHLEYLLSLEFTKIVSSVVCLLGDILLSVL